MQETTFPDINSWLQFQGFRLGLHPFEEVAAEREKDLEGYFIEFPYFSGINRPKPSFLFLGRGKGKSANCRMLERRCQQSLIEESADLAIVYDDFYDLIDKEEVTLLDHTRSILEQAVPRFFDVVTTSNRVEFIQNLSQEEQENFIWFLLRHSNRLSERSLTKQIARISQRDGWDEEQTRSAIQKVSNLAVGALEEAANIALPGSNLLLKAIETLLELKGQREQTDRDAFAGERYHSPRELMKRFAEIAESCQIKHIYILIDRVDEYAAVSDFARAADMLKSLTQTVPFLEMRPFAFKFFLPSEIRPHLKDHLREDKFDIYSYDWQPTDLRDLLERRLVFFGDPQLSSEERKDFARLFTSEARSGLNSPTITEEIINLADGSPRNLIRLAKLIFDEHTRLSPIDPAISLTTYQKAIDRYKTRHEGVQTHG